jgi:hypothetical protein
MPLRLRRCEQTGAGSRDRTVPTHRLDHFSLECGIVGFGNIAVFFGRLRLIKQLIWIEPRFINRKHELAVKPAAPRLFHSHCAAGGIEVYNFSTNQQKKSRLITMR